MGRPAFIVLHDPHAQCVATECAASVCERHAPDDKDALIKLAGPVPQRVLALELQEYNSMGCQPLLQMGSSPIPAHAPLVLGCQAELLC
jgi:hypothetical protein